MIISSYPVVRMLFISLEVLLAGSLVRCSSRVLHSTRVNDESRRGSEDAQANFRRWRSRCTSRRRAPTTTCESCPRRAIATIVCAHRSKGWRQSRLGSTRRRGRTFRVCCAKLCRLYPVARGLFFSRDNQPLHFLCVVRGRFSRRSRDNRRRQASKARRR